MDRRVLFVACGATLLLARTAAAQPFDAERGNHKYDRWDIVHGELAAYEGAIVRVRRESELPAFITALDVRVSLPLDSHDAHGPLVAFSFADGQSLVGGESFPARTFFVEAGWFYVVSPFGMTLGPGRFLFRGMSSFSLQITSTDFLPETRGVPPSFGWRAGGDFVYEALGLQIMAAADLRLMAPFAHHPTATLLVAGSLGAGWHLPI